VNEIKGVILKNIIILKGKKEKLFFIDNKYDKDL
jgi:hypothetical protein